MIGQRKIQPPGASVKVYFTGRTVNPFSKGAPNEGSHHTPTAVEFLDLVTLITASLTKAPLLRTMFNVFRRHLQASSHSDTILGLLFRTGATS